MHADEDEPARTCSLEALGQPSVQHSSPALSIAGSCKKTKRTVILHVHGCDDEKVTSTLELSIEADMQVRDLKSSDFKAMVTSRIMALAGDIDCSNFFVKEGPTAKPLEGDAAVPDEVFINTTKKIKPTP